MYIDSHAHYDMKVFNRDRGELLSRLQNNGIEVVINAATKYESNFTMQEKLDAYDWVYYSAGIHPNHVGVADNMDAIWEKGLQSVCANKNKIVAVGETGLDFYRLNRNETGELDEESVLKVKRQYKWFRKQIELAICKELPLILHVRDAHQEAIDIIKEYVEDLPRQNAGVIHCFNGDLESALKYIDMGFYLGIGGLVTDIENQTLRNVVEKIPLSSIVLETDAPYVTPADVEEKRNSSLNIPIIAKEIAEIIGVSVEIVERTTTNNAKELFKKVAEYIEKKQVD